MHVETFFARNLGGLIHARTYLPGRLGKAQAARRACTWMRSRMGLQYRGSDRTKEATSSGGRGWKGLTQGKQLTEGRGSDSEPNSHVDPIGGCALDRGESKPLALRRST